MMSRTRVFIYLAIAALGLFAPASSRAHIQRFSNSDLSWSGSQADWVLRVHLSDFEQMFRGTPDADVLAFLPHRLELKSGGQSCRIEDSKIEKDLPAEVVTIRLKYLCPDYGNALQVYYGLFYGDADHRHLVKFTRDGKTQGFTFNPRLTEKEFQTPSSWIEFRNFLRLGFDHILSGLDHILFILSLVFGAKRFKTLFWLVTSFTVAHSLSLGLAVTGVFGLSPQIVEPAIAASIAFVAIRHALARQDQDFRGDVFVTFFFGLIHGLGFSGALQEANLTAGHMALPLFSFNLGVEVGQVLIVLAVFPLLQGLEKLLKGSYLWFKRAALLGMAGMGVFWMVQRLVSG